jgi:preprotein translocase subunit SecY
MFAAIANTFSNCFKIPELKSRILFTLAVLAICRLEAVVRIPGLDGTALTKFFESHAGSGASVLGMYSLFTGGALEHCAVGALGIMPYISATINRAVADGGGSSSEQVGSGRRWTHQDHPIRKVFDRAALPRSGAGHGYWLGKPRKVVRPGIGRLVLYSEGMIWWYRIQTLLILTTGTLLLMWLGEQITERGIGNGVSLVITIGILARLPQAVVALKDMFFPGGGLEAQFNFGHALALVLLLAGVIAGVIAITQAQRKVPVQYAQRAVGRKVYSGGTSFMPLRVNYAGVMPIIFAQAILMFPQKIFCSWARV